jgi:hypothetical protein
MTDMSIEGVFEQELLHIYGPIVADFEVTQRPQGGAPEYIRDMWIGAVLPVRGNNLGSPFLSKPTLDILTCKYNTIDDRVPVCGVEAVVALNSLGRVEAVQFFAPVMGGIFSFRGNEGTLLQRT